MAAGDIDIKIKHQRRYFCNRYSLQLSIRALQ